MLVNILILEGLSSLSLPWQQCIFRAAIVNVSKDLNVEFVQNNDFTKSDNINIFISL